VEAHPFRGVGFSFGLSHCAVELSDCLVGLLGHGCVSSVLEVRVTTPCRSARARMDELRTGGRWGVEPVGGSTNRAA